MKNNQDLGMDVAVGVASVVNDPVSREAVSMAYAFRKHSDRLLAEHQPGYYLDTTGNYVDLVTPNRYRHDLGELIDLKSLKVFGHTGHGAVMWSKLFKVFQVDLLEYGDRTVALSLNPDEIAPCPKAVFVALQDVLD